MKLKLSTTSFKRSKKLDKKGLGGAKRRRWRLRTSPLTFLVFFALASAFWVLNRMQTKLSRDLDIIVSLENLPPAYTIQKAQFQDTIHLRILDFGFQHIRYDINGFAPIVLPLRYNKNNKPYLALSKEALKQEITTRLSPTAIVQRQNIEVYHLNLKPRLRKKLPIKFQGELNLANGYTITKQTVKPDSIIVYGEHSVLDTLKSIKNIYFKSDELTSPLNKKLKLALPNNVHSLNKGIKLEVQVEQLTEKVFSCPIRTLSTPKGFNLIALPSNVIVKVTLPRSFHNKLTEADIIPTINYLSTLQDKNISKLEVKLKDYPKFIRSIHIEPKRVQFVIEKE